MARIYRNAVVVITTSSVTAHNEGYFTKRNRTRPATASPLDSRGWIFQEQLLSPRILKYEEGRIELECITKSAVELGHNKSRPPNTLIEAQRFKKVLRGIRLTSRTLDQQAHTSWQHVVASYSKRTLTDSADKLAAILGIANFLGDIVGDQLLAGVWRKRIWHDLLWKPDVNPYQQHLPSQLNNFELPSRSWASVDGPISYATKEHHSTLAYTRAICVLSVDVEHDLSSKCVRGRLTVETKKWRLFHRSTIQTQSDPSLP
jgi:hypothetical protein